jgi:hypothetical protein
LDFPGFTVCNAGDRAMNGFYSQVDASSFQLNTSTFQHKNMLFFDVTPLPHMKGPYGWELYSYTLLHKPVTKYIVSVEDFVDPPPKRLGRVRQRHRSSPRCAQRRRALPVRVKMRSLRRDMCRYITHSHRAFTINAESDEESNCAACSFSFQTFPLI